MKILVTGASGFLGRNIVPVLLDEGFEVFNMSLTPCKNTKNIIFDGMHDNVEDALLGLDFDYVIHMAAYSTPKLATDIEKTKKLNVDFTEELLSHFSNKNIKKFIFFSTVLTYAPSNSPLTENSPQSALPNDYYTASKIEAEKVCKEYIAKGMPVTILRLTNCFGPYQDWKNKPNLIPQIMIQAIHERKITVYNGDFARDFLYSQDLGRLLPMMLKATLPDILNISTGKVRRVIEVGEFVAKKLNIGLVDLKEELDKPKEIKISDVLFKKIIPEFEFTDFEQALKRTLDYYLDILKKDIC